MSHLETYTLLSKSFGGKQGTDFQLNLLKLFAIRGLNRNLEFKLWTEDEAADKFDDLLFSYNSGSETHFTFLQAKHKLSQMHLELSTFFSDKNYNLYKYFKSFIQIEEKFKIDYKTNYIDDLILSTNNVLPKLDVNDKFCELSYQTSDYQSVLYFEQIDKHSILSNEGKLFKFDSTKETENLNFLRLKFFAIEFAQMLFDHNFEPFFLQQSRDFVLTFLDIGHNSVKFKNDFWDSEDDDINNFKVLFKDLFEQNSVNISTNQKNKMSKVDFWEFFKRFTFNENFNEKLRRFQDDVNLIENKIKLFLSKMLFSTEVEDSALDRNTSLAILPLINDFSQLDKASNLFHKHFESWIKFSMPSQEIQILRNQNENLWVKLSKSKLLTLFEPILKQFVSKISSYEFCGPQKLKDFFTSSPTMTSDCRCLIYEVSKGETSWGFLKIYSLNKSIVYLKSSDTDFEKVLEIFKGSSNEFTLVIECHKNKPDGVYLKKIVQKFADQSNANILIVCTKEISGSLNAYEKLPEGDTLCDQLSNKDFEKIKNKEIRFQGIDVALKELFEDDQLKNIALRNMEDLIEIGVSLIKPEIYLPRKLLRKDHLKREILYQLTKNIVFDEQDFAVKLGSNLDAHLIEKSNQDLDLIWKKSSKSIDVIRLFTQEQNKTEISDEKFSENKNQVNIIQDIPGMGKSVFLDFLSYKLKENHPTHWVQKFELQTCVDELQAIEDNVDKTDDKGMLILFIKKFLKFKSKSFEEMAFENLFKKGLVTLFFDGFDEIASSHKEVLIKIVSKLSRSNNQFYVSTRPEWSEMLENQLKQLAFFFEPLSHEDQKIYLLQLWKKDETYDEKAEKILEKLNKTITKREETFTGIPLITRLVGEFFEDKIDDEQTFENSLNTHLSLFELLKYFFDKKIEIYLIEKRGMKKNSKYYGRDSQVLKNKLIKLAVNLIFPKSTEAAGENINEEDISEFIDCGLVLQSNGKLKILHQVIAEFMVALHFRDNFGKAETLEFLFEKVLVEDGYQMIRFFINVFIQDVVDDANLKDLIRTHTKVLFVAAKETNIETFDVCFDTLYEDLDESELYNLMLFGRNQKQVIFVYGEILLYILHKYNDIASTTYLDKIYDKIGYENFKEILRTQNEIYRYSILQGLAEDGKNYTLVIKWIIEKYSSEPEFIKEIMLMKCKNRANILFNVAKKFDKQSFVDFLNELRMWENTLQISLLRELLIDINSDGQTIIEYIVSNSEEKSEIVETVVDLLNWMHQYNPKVLEDFFQIEEAPFLAFVAEYLENHICKFLEFLCNFEEPIKVLQCKKIYFDVGAPFFFYLFEAGNFAKSLNNFENVITFIRDNFKDYDVKDFLNEKTENGDNLLGYIFTILITAQKAPLRMKTSLGPYPNQFIIIYLSLKDFSDLIDCLDKIDRNLVRNLVLNTNNDGQNIFHKMCLCDNVSKSDIPTFFNHLLENLTDYFKQKPECLTSLLTQKDNTDNKFLYYIFSRNPRLEPAAEAACIILDSVKKIDVNLVENLLFNNNNRYRSCFYAICRVDYEELFYTPIVFKKMLTFLEQNSHNFSIKTFLSDFLTEDYWPINEFLHYFFPLYPKVDSVAENVCEILDWLKEIDIKLFKYSIFKLTSDSTFIHHMCGYTPIAQLSITFEKIATCLRRNLSDSRLEPNLLIELLSKKDQYGHNILYYIFSRHHYSVEIAEAAIKILEWVKNYNAELHEVLIFNENNADENFIHVMCSFVYRNDLSNNFTRMVQYLIDNFPDLNLSDYLSQTDKYQKIFLDKIFQYNDDSRIDTLHAKTTCQILNWIGQKDYQFMKQLIFDRLYSGENFMHFVCLKSVKFRLPEIFKIFVRFLLETIPDFDIKDYLKQKNGAGKTCIDCIDLNANPEYYMNPAKLQIETWLGGLENGIGLDFSEQSCDWRLNE